MLLPSCTVSGGTATVDIDPGVPVTFNHAGLTDQLSPTLEAIYGAEQVSEPARITGAEDFSFFQEQVPGFSSLLAGDPLIDQPVRRSRIIHLIFMWMKAPLPLGVHAMSRLASDYLRAGAH